MKEIICPYCFRKFQDDKVVFRANYMYQASAETTDGLFARNNSKDVLDEEEQARKLFAPFVGPYGNTPGKHDYELEEFWKNRGQQEGFANIDKKWSYPHIDPSKPDEFMKMIKHEEDAGADGFVRDRDGWIIRVNERFGDNTIKMAKLCPHCHNPLPFTEYGKYETIFISVVGIRASGKTVYINQLLSNFSHYIAQTGYTMSQTALASGVEEVKKNRQLPDSTDVKTMRRPSAILLRKPNENDCLTVVFYDIAGEHCVNNSGDENSAVARFLAFSHGLIFLIDPEQVPIYATREETGERDIQNVMNVVNGLRSAYNLDEPLWDNIPVAVVLTKSDTIEKTDGVPEIIYQPNSYVNSDQRGFNRNEFDEINDALEEEFSAKVKTIMESLKGFPKKGYFAVSAITSGVANRFQRYRNLYTLSDEDYRRFIAIRNWATAWESRDEEERKHFAILKINDRNGHPIQINVNQKPTDDELKDIETDIKATATHAGGSADTLYLTLGDVAKELSLLGYPLSDPNPRRIEEPFLWILWQLRKIGPYPRMAEPYPKKGLFENQKKYEERCLAYEREQIARTKSFYACTDLSHGKPISRA